MRWMSSALVFALVIALVALGLPARSDLETPALVDSQQLVESLSVRIDIGTDGEALDEAVALDLGLGFPLWLNSPRDGQSDRPRFGAFPRRGDPPGKAPPGSSLSYGFQSAGEGESDELHFSRQLLDGVKIADISRIGFASRGRTHWQLAGYEVKVNGEILAANDKVDLHCDEALNEWRFELADLESRIGPVDVCR